MLIVVEMPDEASFFRGKIVLTRRFIENYTIQNDSDVFSLSKHAANFTFKISILLNHTS